MRSFTNVLLVSWTPLLKINVQQHLRAIVDSFKGCWTYVFGVFFEGLSKVGIMSPKICLFCTEPKKVRRISCRGTQVFLAFLVSRRFHLTSWEKRIGWRMVRPSVFSLATKWHVNISPPPSAITSTTTISTICAGGITSDMRMGGDNIPQYIPTTGVMDTGILTVMRWGMERTNTQQSTNILYSGH